MTYFIGDGFDTYAAIADASANVGNGGCWEFTFGWTLSNVTRFATGQSLTGGTDGTNLTKNGGPNSSTWFVTFAHMQTSALSGTGGTRWYTLSDGATAQVTIFIMSNGDIKFFRGNQSGTLIVTWTSAFVANSYDHYQFKIVIDPAAGSILVKKNRALSDTTIDFIATSLNTRASANSYANGFAVGHLGGGFAEFTDDLLVYDGAGSAPNDWVGDIRAIQMQPIFDTAQKQFTQNANGTSLGFGTTTNTSTRAIPAGAIQTGEIISATQGGTFTTATVEFNAGFTGNAKLALYFADGDTQGFVSNNKPGTLIATSNVVTNPVLGTNTFTFASAIGIMKGYGYFFTLLTDANCTVKANSSMATCYSYPNPPSSYADGFPASLATLTTGASVTRMTAYTTLTATNTGLVSDFAEDGTTTYLSDSVVGHYDLSNISPLSYTPAAIIGATLRAFVAKSDASAKGFKIAGKSNATAFETAEYLPLTVFSSFQVFYPNDPATGAAWTPPGLNNLQIGPKVSS
jgi:hypothetical protein